MMAGAAQLAREIRARLQTQWLARELHAYDEVDSTNRVALALAREGAPHGAAVIAEAQSAGRGRHGRTFFSPPGRNLYTTVVLRPPAGAEGLSPATVLGAGLAVAQSVAAELPEANAVAIKWPNDVLIRGRKTSGVLMEAVQNAAGGGAAAALGIGVNLNLREAEFPQEFRARATSLGAAAGRAINRAAFAARLYTKLESVLDAFATAGFETLRPEFMRYFRMQGARVRCTNLAGEVQAEGAALGVAADGALRIRTTGGAEQRVLAGDVTIAKENA